MPSLAVCHLVREVHGPEVFANFIISYRSHAAGAEHDLVLLVKGFADEKLPPEYQDIVRGVRHTALPVPDTGFDIGSYFTAAERLQHDYLCFLNSYSMIQSENWLQKLFQPLADPSIGITGATGSWESNYTNFEAHLRTLAPRSSRFPLRRLASEILRQRRLRQFGRWYDPFPNYHIRTNAFVLPRERMLSLRHPAFATKADAEHFESGRGGLTSQICRLGLKPVVVGRDERVYEKEQWHQSRTFRSGHQENLLVADNRTAQYEAMSETEQAQYQRQTWGQLVTTDAQSGLSE